MGGYSIPNPIKNPVGALLGVTTAPLVVPAMLGVKAGTAAVNQIGQNVNLIDTPEEKAAKASAEEQAARTGAYNDAINNGGLDRASLQDITALYQSGADSAKIASTIAAARTGKGIYAVRIQNQAQADYLKNNPGRKATTSTLGYGSVI